MERQTPRYPYVSQGRVVAKVTVNTCASQGTDAEHEQRRCGTSERCANVVGVEASQTISDGVWDASNCLHAILYYISEQNRCLSEAQGRLSNVLRPT